MKNLLVTLLASAYSAVAFAQGTVLFSNQDAASGTDFPFYLADGTTKLSGSQFMAELVAGATPSSLATVAQVGFLTGANAGYFNGGVVSVSGLAPSSVAFLQVRVWNTATGATFFQAAASGLFNAFALTPVQAITLGGNGNPAATLGQFGNGPYLLSTPVPEPSALSFCCLGAAAVLLVHRKVKPNHPVATKPAMTAGCYAECELRRFVDRDR